MRISQCLPRSSCLYLHMYTRFIIQCDSQRAHPHFSLTMDSNSVFLNYTLGPYYFQLFSFFYTSFEPRGDTILWQYKLFFSNDIQPVLQ